MNRKYTLILILIVISILLIAIIPYRMTFQQYKLSLNPNDWGAFGSYISGILSIINLFIFILLTFYISRLDEKRSQGDKILQKKITITQFRQSELALLDNKLDEILETNGMEEKPIVLQRLTSASLILTNFINQKIYLFPILQVEAIKQKALDLLDKLNQFHDIIDDIYSIPLDKTLQEKMEDKLQAYIFMKNEFIENLQTFILNGLD